MDNDNGDNIDEKAYITPICGELATKEEVNKVDLQDVKIVPSHSKLDFGTKFIVVGHL